MKKCIAVIIFLIVLIFIFVFVLDSVYNLRHYFDKWESETNDDVLHVINEIVVYSDSEELWIRDLLEKGLVEEVFLAYQDRVYFCYSTTISKTEREWHLASVDLNGENWEEHYSGLVSQNHYEKLSCLSDITGVEGGMAFNNQIFLCTSDKTIAYDFVNDTIQEDVEMPGREYSWEINERQEIIFKNIQTQEIRICTLEQMAETNIYAQKLLDIASRKTWDGTSVTKGFFAAIKVDGDRIYIVCELSNWLGEAHAIVFQYDFSSNEVLYVASFKTDERVSSAYSFAFSVQP